MLALGRLLWILILTLLTLSYVTVSLRLWVRCRITKTWGWDDAAMVATLTLFTCYCAFIIITTLRAAENRLFDAQSIHVTLVYIQLSEVFYILTTTTLKISLGLFFLRVLTKRWQTMIFHVVLCISATYGLFYVLTTIFACGDPAQFADAMMGSKKCLPKTFQLTTGYLYGAINVISDWTFVLIPISVLLDSDLDRRAKISVGIVMALGAIGSVSSILRMVYLKGLIIRGMAFQANTIKATIWASAEPGTGIIAASTAILRPLIRNITTSIRSARKGSITPTDEDSVALTLRAGKKKSMYSLGTEDPWSPTTSFAKRRDQRAFAVHSTVVISKV
ncbi:hypothetical protein GQ44DRAFT_752789 [Phaeosphaeriaceae sp. PMI808]|nr:hypothetical protein GQ44DRAFT_752789 [Phaeosphaeriaceae sp. PMI808]